MTVCAKCALLFCGLVPVKPGSVCPTCWNAGWRPDDAGGVYQLEVIAVQALDGRYHYGPPRLAEALASEETGPYPDRDSAERAARQARP